MKEIDLTLKNTYVKGIVELLDKEISRLIKEDNEDWKKVSEIKGAIIISIYEHAIKE